MTTKTLAIISDLHCHPSSRHPAASFLHSDMLRSPASRHPVAALLQLFERESLTADALLVPGDITNAIDQQGFVAGWNFVKEVAHALHVTLTAATIGNHDVDSRGETTYPDPFYTAKHLDPDHFPTDTSKANQQFWADGFCILEVDDLRVLIVNSTLDHYKEEPAKRGGLIDAQIEKIDAATSSAGPARFQVAIVHHHPLAHEALNLGSQDLMEKGSILLERLHDNGYQLLVHGHKHYPRLSYSNVGTPPLPVFAAGSLSAHSPSMLSNTRNLFHLVTLDSTTTADCGSCGTIRSWEFNLGKGWRIPNEQSVDLPPRTGFGCHLPPRTLAQRTADLFSARGYGVVPWSTVLADIPQLRFVIPVDFEAYRASLRDGHGIHLLNDGPDTWIGRPTSGPN